VLVILLKELLLDMKHDLIIEGPAFRLRPISDADAAFVLDLRGNKELNRYLHATSQSLTEQCVWFARYYDRPGDYYFVIERQDSGAAEGVISIYDVDLQANHGEWGRWILRPDSLAAVESAWLIYRCAFEKLGLDSVCCRTVADNSAVVSFHDSCDIKNRTLLTRYFDLGGKRLDAVEHQVDVDTWSRLNPKLEKLAQLVARRLQNG